MAAPYVLAKTMADAHRFAQEDLGLPRGHYRVVTSPSSVKGIFGADLYLVPGWETRFDRFTMQSALRWTRLNKIEVTRDEEPETDGLNPPGVQLSLIDDEEANALLVAGLPSDDTLEPEGWSPPEVLTTAQVLDLAANPKRRGADVLSTEEPKKRRRRRCKDCNILVEPDDVDTHICEEG